MVLKAHALRSDSSVGEAIKVQRKGGGSLIEICPVFSADSKCVYVCCEWGVQAFCTLTGECLREYDAQLEDDRVVGVAVLRGFVTALTSLGLFVKWEAVTGIAVSTMALSLRSESTATALKVLPPSSEISDNVICVLQRKITKKNIYLGFYDTLTGEETNFGVIPKLSISDLKHGVAFGVIGRERFMVAILEGSVVLKVTLLSTKKIKTMSLAGSIGRKWTCVSCHPEEASVAAGDMSGRIVLWREPFVAKRTIQTVFHWHTLPVRDITFSASGSHMYSGGEECVLVKWALNNPSARSFLPRLPAPIAHVVVSSNNQAILLSTLDNGIQVVDGQLRPVSSIQQLAWGMLSSENGEQFPAGFNWDARMKALVFNGRPGYIQFYSPYSASLLYSVDITCRNYVTQERTRSIVNTEVTRIALSNNGSWLATVETRLKHSDTSQSEIRLKFWQFVAKSQTFSLNTSVEFPHYSPIATMRFQPRSEVQISEQHLNYLLVTTAADNRFRIWTLSPINSIYRTGVIWGCDSVGFYRSLPAGPAAFSTDGSLLGVGFAHALTIWDIDTNSLQASLTRDSEPLRCVEFGRCDCSHLVVSAGDSWLCVWSLLTLSSIWSVNVQLSILTADPLSQYMALFTLDNTLLVFTPSSPVPVLKKEKICKAHSRVSAAIFVPREQSPTSNVLSWLCHSQLYFIDSNQEMHLVDTETEIERMSGGRLASLAHAVSAPQTAFSSLLAAQSVSKVETESSKTHTQFGVAGANTIRQLLQSPAHTMPPISLLCAGMIRSLVITREGIQDSHNIVYKKEEVHCDVFTDYDMDVDELLEKDIFGANETRLPGNSTNKIPFSSTNKLKLNSKKKSILSNNKLKNNEVQNMKKLKQVEIKLKQTNKKLHKKNRKHLKCKMVEEKSDPTFVFDTDPDWVLADIFKNIEGDQKCF